MGDYREVLKTLDSFKAEKEKNPIHFERFHKKLRVVFQDDSKEIHLFGGNRSGKTTYGGNRCDRLALEKPGASIWCGTLDFKTSVRVQQKKIWDMLPKGRVSHGNYHPLKGFTDQAVSISHEQGEDSIIAFKSYDSGVEKFQSDSCDLIWLDEEPDFGIYQECLLRLLDRNGALIVTMTSLKGFTDFIKETYDKWVKKERKDISYHFIETEDNLIENGGGLTREAYERIIDKIPEYDKKSRLKGIPSVRKGLIFKEWEDAPPFIIPRFKIPDDWTRYLIIDPHEKTPTAALQMCFDPNNVCYITNGQQFDGTVPEIAEEIVKKWGPIKQYRKKLMDHSANVAAGKSMIYGANIAHRFSLAGIPCELTNQAIKDINAGIDAIRTRMTFTAKDDKPMIRVFDDILPVRNEIKNHNWNEEGTTPAKREKHFVDCIKYGLNYGFKFVEDAGSGDDLPYYAKEGYRKDVVSKPKYVMLLE